MTNEKQGKILSKGCDGETKQLFSFPSIHVYISHITQYSALQYQTTSEGLLNEYVESCLFDKPTFIYKLKKYIKTTYKIVFAYKYPWM